MPPSATVSSIGKAAIRRFRRKVNGTPIRAAQSIKPPLPRHGVAGVWFIALVFAEMVIVEVPVPPAVSVTGLAVAVTFAAVPSVEVTLVAKVTVPA
jgi:hypothetical protein